MDGNALRFRRAVIDDIAAIQRVGKAAWTQTYAPLVLGGYIEDGLANYRSTEAFPELLARLLESFAGTHIHTVTFALVDDRTRNTIPYLARKLAFYARYALYEPFCFDESVDAALRLSL